ncbi:extracellular solute-binding protein [Streptomyces armeniacus]|uniref:Extracellular solute-binding protein n=1 Tax=Streptomyces armeniacus TaxID=83291 RepID=A0A345XP35_9ACTN|nr:extracellular solute-binding protein [Streptomyces armeniacus]AXK33401.1 extracellular solute-binding protein [Streptomyces armeniacus]
MRRTGSRRIQTAVTTALATALVLSVTAACGSDGDNGDRGGGGKVELDINGQPPSSQQQERALFDADVKAFEKANPDIDLVPHEGFMEPKTFQTKLAGGKLEDVFYTYFTDPAGLIAKRQAADITEHVKDLPHYGDIKPELLKIYQDEEGRQFGLPTANYSMGLVYNRKLFEQAGLDPDRPPATWDEVRAAAKKISGLGKGHVGYADLSKNNQGGWHFTAELYSRGGTVAKQDGDTWKASFNDSRGEAVLRTLHDMRWKDGSMGSKQLLEDADLQRMMGAGKLGMYVAAGDNIPVVVKEFDGQYDDYGLAPVPEGRGTLIGGEGYMFNPKASPEQIKAGVKWIHWRFLTPETIERTAKWHHKRKLPVGLPVAPTPDNWNGATRQAVEKIKKANANVPVGNYAAFTDKNVPGVIEPPEAQQVYAALDKTMQAVLTKEDADIGGLLDKAEDEVNQIYARVR